MQIGLYLISNFAPAPPRPFPVHRFTATTSRMVSGGRIVKQSRARQPRIDGGTLLPISANAQGSEVRRDMAREDITMANVRAVSSLSLLRVQARTIRAAFERVYRVTANTGRVPFRFELSTAEGTGDDASRIRRLSHYVAVHKKEIGSRMDWIMTDSKRLSRLRKENKGGGKLRRKCIERDAAIDGELATRTVRGTLLQQDGVAATANAANATATAITERSVDALANSYPAEFANQVRRVSQEMEAEERGVKKPSSNDKLLVARTVAFERGDMATVEACDKIQERRRASKRAARARKKVRKAALKEYIARTHGPSDPNSDNE